MKICGQLSTNNDDKRTAQHSRLPGADGKTCGRANFRDVSTCHGQAQASPSSPAGRISRF
jgi:hypothetical protein